MSSVIQISWEEVCCVSSTLSEGEGLPLVSMVVDWVSNPERNAIWMVRLVGKTIIPWMVARKELGGIHRVNSVKIDAYGCTSSRDVLRSLLPCEFHKNFSCCRPSIPICSCHCYVSISSVPCGRSANYVTRSNIIDSKIRDCVGSNCKVMAIGVLKEFFHVQVKRFAYICTPLSFWVWICVNRILIDHCDSESVLNGSAHFVSRENGHVIGAALIPRRRHPH